MLKYNKNQFTTSNIFFQILTLLLINFLVGCSKKSDINTDLGPTGTRLSFNVIGISDPIMIGPNDHKALTSSIKHDTRESFNTPRSSAITSHANENGFTIDATAELSPIISPENQKQNKHTTLKNQRKNITAISPMEIGFTYRIFIYRDNSPVLWQSIQTEAGQPIHLDVSKGATYKWFAYSYNNNESLPLPSDTQNPTVAAPIEKDLLYASGELTIPNTPVGENHVYPINITFNHKMAKISVRIDANVLSKYATVKGIKAQFSQNDYIKNGTFNIKNNVMDSYNVVETTEIFNSTTSNPTNIWEASFNTADASSLTSYKVKITDLPVEFTGVDPGIASVNLATFSSSTTPTPNIEATFNYLSPSSGQDLRGILNLSYTLASKRILHVSNATDYGYSFQKGPSWKMINALENFGNLPNSLVRMQPYANGQGVWIGGSSTNDETSNFLLAVATTTRANEIIAKINPENPADRPDIVIFAFDHYYFTTNLQIALVDYINAGGVFIMMNEFTVNTNGPQAFVNRLFNNPTTPITLRSLGSAGSMYRLLNIDDQVLNGPFGNARGKLWGEDASTTVGALNLPVNDVIIYSYGQPINRSSDATDAITVSMFRHKTKHFFYLGDGGLISYDGGVSSTICPFDFNPTTKRPIPKLYGNAGNGYTSRSDYAYNGIIAGNIMLWAGELAEFKGIKKWKYRPD